MQFQSKCLKTREIFGIKQVRECGSSLRHRIKTNGISQSALDGGCPGSRIPSGACQPKFKVARSLRKCVFCDKFEIVGLIFFPSELRQPTWRLLFPIFDVIHISEKELRMEKNVGAFNLGACEVARSLQARLAGSHGF